MSHLQTSAPCHQPSRFVRARHWIHSQFRLQDRALLCCAQKGAALDCSLLLGPLPSWLSWLRRGWVNKHHQLSPTPVSWMRPGSWDIPPPARLVMAGSRLQSSCLPPASQPSRGFIQTQLLSKSPMSVSLPPPKGSLTYDLTWQPLITNDPSKGHVPSLGKARRLWYTVMQIAQKYQNMLLTSLD